MSESLENATKVAEFLKTEVSKAQFEEGTVITFDRVVEIKPSAAQRRRMARAFQDDEDDDLLDEEYKPREGEVLPVKKQVTYAALFTNKHWYFTGQGDLGKSKLKTRELLEQLVDGEFTNVKVATGFMPIAD